MMHSVMKNGFDAMKIAEVKTFVDSKSYFAVSKAYHACREAYSGLSMANRIFMSLCVLDTVYTEARLTTLHKDEEETLKLFMQSSLDEMLTEKKDENDKG